MIFKNIFKWEMKEEAQANIESAALEAFFDRVNVRLEDKTSNK